MSMYVSGGWYDSFLSFGAWPNTIYLKLSCSNNECHIPDYGHATCQHDRLWSCHHHKGIVWDNKSTFK